VIGAGQLNPTSVEGDGDNPDRASSGVSRETKGGRTRLQYPNPLKMRNEEKESEKEKRRD
jgi:hypothetical protein